MNAAEAVIKQAIEDGFSPEEAMALMVIGATATVCLHRVRRQIAKRKSARKLQETQAITL